MGLPCVDDAAHTTNDGEYMRRLTLTALCLGVLAAAITGGAFAAATNPNDLTPRLCRDGGGDWTRVVPVAVTNQTDADYVERVISLPIAGMKDASVVNAFPFVGELAQSLRVCDEQGVEVLFNVTRPDGSFVDKGEIPDGCFLSFPVTVPAGADATYYVFAGNPLAYPNPDRLDEFHKSTTNLDFESGSNAIPDGWIFDGTDAERVLRWVDESPYSGSKCVRCDVVKGLSPSWIAARQTQIAIIPGAKYRFSAYVHAENLDGKCGWYLHLGNRENNMLASPMMTISKPEFGWTRVEHEFTAPENVTLLDFGTVLYGTGTAWYDAASLVRLDAADDDATASLLPKGVSIGEELALTVPPTVGMTLDAFSLDSPIPAGARVATLRVNPNPEGGDRLIAFDLSTIETRWGRTLEDGDFTILDHNGRPVAVEYFQGKAFFSAELVPGARNLFTVYETDRSNIARRAIAPGRNVANQAFPGTMMQGTNAEQSTDEPGVHDGSLSLPQFILERNLLSDGDFENVGANLPDGVGSSFESWSHDAPEPGFSYSLVDAGIPELGSRSLRVETTNQAPRRWRGWRRRVKATPGQTYLIGYAVSCDSEDGSYDMFIHWRHSDGSLAKDAMASLGQPISGKTDWTVRASLRKATADAECAELHLTSQNYGVVSYDSVFILPIEEATAVEFSGGKAGVFQIPAVAKVFPDTTFSASAQEVSDQNPASCALALGEEETLQVAVRLPGEIGGATLRAAIDVSAPILEDGAALGAPDVFVVGNVLVDYPTNYYQSHEPATTRKFPTGTPACDGWIGLWPDPLIPVVTKDSPDHADAAAKRDAALAGFGDPKLWNDSQRLTIDAFDGKVAFRAGETRAIWLRFKTDAATRPGVYKGVLTLTPEEGGDATTVPYAVEVLSFTAPQTKVTGIYDARISHDYFGNGSRTEKLLRVEAKLLDRKLGSDKPIASLNISYDKATGTASADWTEYDAAVSRYFDERGGKAAYFPQGFYLFGWGNPPTEIEGEKPYPGEWPYDGADRALLRPEYKRAYQAKLKLFWEHLKAKGWADKCVLYISDEPFYSKPEIITQMKALCDMIHEVDPEIPIYSSTWVFVPEWLGYLDVWGVGHYGAVSAESLKKIHDAGSRVWWTTDGQMCLDTPLCAVERLLPYTCVAYGAEAYEFWGASWYTCNPFDSASHLYISQSDQPGVRYYVRYPSGDGYIFYPGELIGRPGEVIDSIRSEQAREGIEDAGWLVGLQQAIEKTPEDSPKRALAQAILDRALYYLPLDCGSGRYSSRYISDPKGFEGIRLDVGRALEMLQREE